ncbi:MAG: hypothetical protein DME21_13080, partial [Verrucomicrobia bacterium]
MNGRRNADSLGRTNSSPRTRRPQLAPLASDSVIDEADPIVFNSRGYVFSDEGRVREAGGAR